MRRKGERSPTAVDQGWPHQVAVSATTSAANLRFLSFVAARSFRNLKFKSRTRFIELLVVLRFRSSYRNMPRALTNFGIGPLVPRSHQPGEELLYRLRMPPRVPRTMARPMVLPIDPPTDLPRSPATLPATRFTTERVTSRATYWPTVSRWPRTRLVPKIPPSAAPMPLTQLPTPPDSPGCCSLPGGGAVVEPVFCTRPSRTS